MTILNVESITALVKIAALNENNVVVAAFERMPKRNAVLNGENVDYSGTYCTHFVLGNQESATPFDPNVPFEPSNEEFLVGTTEIPYIPNFVFTDNVSEEDDDDVIQFKYTESEGKHFLTTSLNTKYTYIDYSATINIPTVGWTYDVTKNAFIPPCPAENYVLDETTFEWHPDPEKDFILHDDGKPYRYNPENKTWTPNW